jgi:uncharacterized protein YgiM (DUF1202 family)
VDQERSDLLSGNLGESAGIDAVFVINCPHLGMLEDSITSLAYPSPVNHCFRLESPIDMDLVYQKEYCLSGRHTDCHIFQMANLAAVDAKLVAPLTAPELRKRRISLYAFPLILILILLAAVIWWPAPGTTIQESLVLGAQNDIEASGSAALNGKPVSQSAAAEKAVEETSPDDVGEPATTIPLNEFSDQAKQKGADSPTYEPARNSYASNGQILASPGTGMAVVPDQQAGVARSEESNTEPAIEPAQLLEVEALVETQISIEEANPETVTKEAGVASDEDTDESPAVVIADLPVISSDILAVTTYPVIRSAFVDTGALNVRSGPGIDYEAITVINSGELVGLIGRHELGPWVRIRLDSGLEGWVNSILLVQVS